MNVHRCSYPAWELLYGTVIHPTTLESICSPGWFLADQQLFVVAVVFDDDSIYYKTSRAALSNVLSMGLLWYLPRMVPNHHATAYFTGFVLQACQIWGSIRDLAENESTEGGTFSRHLAIQDTKFNRFGADKQQVRSVPWDLVLCRLIERCRLRYIVFVGACASRE